MLDEHGEEQDEKTKRDLEILKKYHKKETKSVKKYLNKRNFDYEKTFRDLGSGFVVLQ